MERPFVLTNEKGQAQWIYLAVWGGLGLILWVTARDIRNGVTEQQRRNLILGGAVESDEESG